MQLIPQGASNLESKVSGIFIIIRLNKKVIYLFTTIFNFIVIVCCATMSIIISPEFKKLKNELSDLILIHHELLLQICPNIEREYLLNFGSLEYELYRKDVKLSMLKRKLQLIRIQINNEEEIDIELIDEIVEEEFSKYKENIKKHMDELNGAMEEQHVRFLSKKDTKRLKLIYKQCVLKLHPDLNPNLSNREKDLFIEITEAFKNGNLNALESLYYFVPNRKVEFESEIERLQELIEYEENEIAKIKEKYPYNKKELLLNDNEIYEYKVMLNNLITQFDDDIQRCIDEINLI